MRLRLLFWGISFMSASRCMGEDEGSTEAVRLLVVEDEREISKPLEATKQVYYLDDEDYDIEELHDEKSQEPKQVHVDVKLHAPHKYDPSTKKIDIDVKIKNDKKEEDSHDSDRKYKIKVNIKKETEEEKRENVLIKLVKGAIKYTGF